MKEILCESKFLRLIKDGKWEYVERTTGNDVVSIIPVLENYTEMADSALVFIKEFRPVINKYVVSFPAGKVGDIISGETPEQAAHKELEEEIGYKSGNMRFLTVGPSSAGLTNEITHFFLARDLEKVSEGGGVDDEDIESFIVPMFGVDLWLKKMEESADNITISPRVWAGLYFTRNL